jgi:hypothetical protein
MKKVKNQKPRKKLSVKVRDLRDLKARKEIKGGGLTGFGARV